MPRPVVAIADLDQLETAAAKVADNPVGARKRGEHPKPRIARLFVRADDLAREADPLDLADELRSVGGIANGGRRDDLHLLHAHVVSSRR